MSSWFSSTEHSRPFKSFRARQGPPPAPSRPSQASLPKAKRLFNTHLPLIHHVLRNIVKAHHSKERIPKLWVSLVSSKNRVNIVGYFNLKNK